MSTFPTIICYPFGNQICQDNDGKLEIQRKCMALSINQISADEEFVTHKILEIRYHCGIQVP